MATYASTPLPAKWQKRVDQYHAAIFDLDIPPQDVAWENFIEAINAATPATWLVDTADTAGWWDKPWSELMEQEQRFAEFGGNAGIEGDRANADYLTLHYYHSRRLGETVIDFYTRADCPKV